MNRPIKDRLHLTDSPEESVVWQNLRRGDKKALADIYTKYFDSLYNYGNRIVRDTVIVEDAIQDLFFTLWKLRAGLNANVKNVKQYLYICLRRNILLKLAKRPLTVEFNDIASFDLQLSHKSHYLNNQVNAELRQKLSEMIGMLTPKQKEAVFLIYYDGLSYEEVASIMGLKVKTVYNLIHQAIARLKERKHVFWQMIPFIF